MVGNTHKSKFIGGDIDWITVLVWLALCLIGWFNIHAAVYNPEQPEIFNLNTNNGRQAIFIGTAIILGIIIMIIDAKFYSAISPVIYGITTILLILVLLIGVNIGGNQAWINIGNFRLQPSEFAKLATCLILARYLSSQTNKTPNFKSLLIGLSLIALPVALVFLQPDTGSAITFSALIFVFYREGYVSGTLLFIGAMAIAVFVLTLLFHQWIMVGVIAGCCGILAYLFRKKRKVLLRIATLFIAAVIYVFSVEFAYENILQPHQKSRIGVVLGQIDDPQDKGYNMRQSMIAIGSGQFWGKGYLQGTQTKYNFVPEQSTDFIFCTVGEEWGFWGASIVVGLYLFLLLRIVNIAERQRTAFARIYAYSIASILFFHFAVNIGMTIGLVPVIGIPLPFISYGGSSLWSFSILLFIMIKFDSNRKGIA